MRHMKKRPAAYAPEEPAQYTDQPEAPPTVHAAPWPDWMLPVPEPPWPWHVAQFLRQHGHVQHLGHRQVQLQIWSDCAGVKSEMFALRELGPANREALGIGVQFNWYFACDSDKECFRVCKV